MKQLIVAAFSLSMLYNCSEKSAVSTTYAPFTDTPVSSPMTAGVVDEASGIADSRSNPGFLWVEQDSGNPPQLSLLDYNGIFKKNIHIKGAQNRDWEDMALAKGPAANTNYIYIADIGDNSLQYNSYFIYRFPEPGLLADSITNWEKISFIYPDGPHNAEAILVDDSSRDIYIITKSDPISKIYKLPYPQSSTNMVTASFLQELALSTVTGAAISPDSKEIIVKTYTSLNYWIRQAGETIESTLKKPSSTLPYKLEIQGEAICFKKDNSGFFTLSEKPGQIASVELNFYKRN